MSAPQAISRATEIPGRQRIGKGELPNKTDIDNGSVRLWSNTATELHTVAKATGTNTPTDDDFEFVSLGSQSHTPAKPAAQAAQRATGTVLQVDDDTALCEIQVGSQLWQVNFPRAYFTGDIRYGTPIFVGIKDIGGFRTPVIEIDVTPRACDPEIEELRNALAAL